MLSASQPASRLVYIPFICICSAILNILTIFLILAWIRLKLFLFSGHLMEERSGASQGPANIQNGQILRILDCVSVYLNFVILFV